jgi:hypothetical protein
VRPSVLVVADQPDFRDAAAALLNAEGIDVVGAVEDGPAALAAVDSVCRGFESFLAHESATSSGRRERWMQPGCCPVHLCQ